MIDALGFARGLREFLCLCGFRWGPGLVQGGYGGVIMAAGAYGVICS